MARAAFVAIAFSFVPSTCIVLLYYSRAVIGLNVLFAAVAVLFLFHCLPLSIIIFKLSSGLDPRILMSRLSGHLSSADRRKLSAMCIRKDDSGTFVRALDSLLEEQDASIAAGAALQKLSFRGEQIKEYVSSVSSDISMQSDKTTASSSAVSGIIDSLSATAADTSSDNEMLETTVKEITNILLAIASARTYVDEQSAAVIETSSTIEEMSSQIHSVAESSRRAKELSTELNERARAGGGSVTDAVAAMKGIEEASKQVSAIVSVIRNIAGQTNLLAMNASIEAAHAGEQGKGFAVVANEVRKLAERSAASSAEIDGIVKGIIAKIENGVSIASIAGDAITSIVDNTKKTAEVISAISAANNDQDIAAKELLLTARTLNVSSVKLAEVMHAMQESANGTSAIVGNVHDRLSLTLKKIAETSGRANQVVGLIIEMSSGATEAKETMGTLSAALVEYLTAINDSAVKALQRSQRGMQLRLSKRESGK